MHGVLIDAANSPAWPSRGEHRAWSAAQELLNSNNNESASAKQYYNGVVAANLDQIKALKEDAADSKLMRAAADKAAAEAGAENKRLAELLTKVTASCCEPRSKVTRLPRNMLREPHAAL